MPVDNVCHMKVCTKIKVAVTIVKYIVSKYICTYVHVYVVFAVTLKLQLCTSYCAQLLCITVHTVNVQLYMLYTHSCIGL